MPFASDNFRSQARADIATLIKNRAALWAQQAGGWAVTVEPENRELVDLASATNPVLTWDIVWQTAEQVSMGQVVVRQWGQLVVAAKVKLGAGSDACYKLLDYITPVLDRADTGTVQFLAAQQHAAKELLGWYAVPVVIPFWIDRLDS